MNTDLPLLSVFNNGIDSTITRWCTPSIHPSVPRVRGIYENDISISYHSLGNPSMNTGIFKKANELAAKAYGADHTLFGVNGSTGSNFMVLRALKNQLGPKMKMLAQRNIHKSISVAVEDYQIETEYLDPHYVDSLQIFAPNTIEEVLEGLKRSQANVLLVTNPTYEGLSTDLKKLVKTVRAFDKNIIIFIDEAWGAHFPFSKEMPLCAMKAGADICVQSIHKQGSGLQQTSMIHWNDGRIDVTWLKDSYKSLMTTSPSFHMLASLDGSRYFMEHEGEEAISRLVKLAETFRERVNTSAKLKEKVTAIDCEDLRENYCAHSDATKVLVHLEGFSGMELAKRLEEKYQIIVEKYEANNVLFIVTFQNTKADVEKTVAAIEAEIKKMKPQTNHFPKFPNLIKKKMNSFQAKLAEKESVTIQEAEGRVAAEDVVPYPPGIPLCVKGEVIQPAHINYLKELKKTKELLTVVMVDESVQTIKVVKE
ncbi:aminotransferase class V-fold PLP-dependent enzyme [Patescibacteria group bacterium]|nr:aminotransferase class V-fold PLP-dependent enzyme [Patescibacteria group bacterium]